MRDMNAGDILSALETALRNGADNWRSALDKQAHVFDGQLGNIKSLLVSVRRDLDGLRALSGIKSQLGSKPPPAPYRSLIRSISVRLIAAANYGSDPESLAKELFPNSPGLPDVIKAPDAYMRRAYTSPARTDVVDWAGVLANTTNYPGLFTSLAPASVYSALSRRGTTISLSGTAGVRFPARSAPGSFNPFVGEGATISVRSISLSAGAVLVPHKTAVLSPYTRELAQASMPTIESVIRQGLSDDLSLGVDAVLLGNGAATASQPAGLLNGLTGLTPSAATDPATAAAAAADLSALAAAINPAPSALAFIMNPIQATSLGLLLPGSADLIVSDSVPAKTVIAIDAADFAASADNGQIDVSEDASYISTDAPLPVATGSSGTAAVTDTPHISAWQMAIISVRVIEDVSWAMRRAGRVSYLTGAKW
ncbi:phage major capsid protein [Rhizobium sp. BK661]|uniref:phage major capsid protein n=1 Tax=Rhizobium sp. BK661 TaxID=2586991 RepID=UPI00216A8F5F|nr:phage major capsid protein [Rhizobium sp. BK661]MCS3742590.1 hypothetical protein [Rhizobium sp. BK661]